MTTDMMMTTNMMMMMMMMTMTMMMMMTMTMMMMMTTMMTMMMTIKMTTKMTTKMMMTITMIGMITMMMMTMMTTRNNPAYILYKGVRISVDSKPQVDHTQTLLIVQLILRFRRPGPLAIKSARNHVFYLKVLAHILSFKINDEKHFLV